MNKNAQPHISAMVHVADRIIAGLPDTGHTATRQLYNTVARLRVGLEAITALHNAQNPTETEGAHQKRVATAAAKLMMTIEVARARIHAITHNGADEIDARIAQKIKLVPDGYAAEIRAAFRNMDSKAQFKLLGELVEGNRGPELAAIVKAPAILTGIAAEVQQRYTTAIISKHAPAEMAERDSLLAGFSTALTATASAAKAADAFTDPAKLAAIEAGEQSAAAAAAAFVNATA